jgi:hypothetical protein
LLLTISGNLINQKISAILTKKKKTALNAKSNANPLSLTVPKSPSVVCSPLYAAVSSLLRVGKQRLVQKGLQTAAPSFYT